MRLYVKDEYKKFVKLLEFPSGRYNIGQVFEDFLYMSAIALKNNCDFDKNEEEWYFSIIKKYEREELEVFPKLFAELVKLVINSEDIIDILGEIFETLKLGSKQHGQFFTPNHIAGAMSNMIMDESVTNNEIIKVCDLTCGSGVLLLNAANKFKNDNIDYSKKLLVYGQDIDIRCFCMTYIQLSLAGIPGTVVLGNALTNEKRKIYYTPQYVRNCLEENNKKVS